MHSVSLNEVEGLARVNGVEVLRVVDKSDANVGATEINRNRLFHAPSSLRTRAISPSKSFWISVARASVCAS